MTKQKTLNLRITTDSVRNIITFPIYIAFHIVKEESLSLNSIITLPTKALLTVKLLRLGSLTGWW